MYARPRRRPTQRSAELTAWGAPVAGLIANRNLAVPKGMDGRSAPGARVLDNWFPTARGAVLRRGSEEYAAIPRVEGNDEYTKVLLHMDGTDGSTTFTDVNAGGSAHTWTASGNAQVDRADSKFGGASLLCDGTGDYLSTPDHADFTLGSSDFTIDLWFKNVAATGTQRTLVYHGAGGVAATVSVWLRLTTAGVIEALISNGTSFTAIVGTTVFSDSLNTGRHHVAFVRHGNSIILFIDGVQEASGSFSGSVVDPSGSLYIAGTGGSTTWNGWIDEFRLSVGIARWTANFTPPLVAYAPPQAAGDVDDLFVYNLGNQEELFAYCDGAIHDVTVPALPVPVVTGLTAAGWVFLQFANSGGTFLLGVNGADRMLIYDGEFWYPVGATNLHALDYDTATGAFAIGQTVTGGTSGATGVIRNIVETSGTAGTLIIDGLSGDFQNNEDITDALTGAALADGAQTQKIAALTGVDTDDLSYVWSYKNRIFFAEKETLNAWYLAVDAITGSATKFPLGGVFNLGGSLVFGSSWSIESADGLDARCAFVTGNESAGAGGEGEVAIYAGIDPGDADEWGLIGVYRIGMPMGKKAHVRAGGDLVIATDLGLVPLSVAITRDLAALAPSAQSYPIEDEWADEVRRRSSVEWRCLTWPSGRMAVVALPTLSGMLAKWLVVNVRTGAWGIFTGWDAKSIVVYADRLFFGTANGRIMEANVTGLDDGEPYTATFVPLFDDLGTPASLKVSNLARGVIRAAVGDVESAIAMQVDFNVDLPPAPAATVVPPGSTWGSGVWGTSEWGVEADMLTTQRWVSAGAAGYALAPALRVTSGNLQPLDAEIVRIEAMVTTAEVVT